MEEVKITIELNGKKHEISAANVLIAVANSTEDGKIATINSFISSEGNLNTAMRMYCGLGKYINEQITEIIYDSDVPLYEQVKSFQPSIKKLDGE